MSLETFLQETLEGGKHSWALPLLHAASLGTRSYLRLRHWAYDQGLLRSYSAPLPLIGIGSLMVGGMGKTPFTLFLQKELTKKIEESSICLLSRGYRGALEKQTAPYLLPKIDADPRLFGDEPVLLSHNCGSPVIVCRRRVAAAELARAIGARVAIADDLFQHRVLRPSRQLLLLDGKRPFDNGHLLPRGWLRDLPERMGKADLLVFWGQRPLLAQTQPAIVVDRAIEGLFSWEGSRLQAPPGKAALFCGIAKPERVQEDLTSLGYELVQSLLLGDHRAPTLEALHHFAKSARAKGAHWLFCTEKDRVKWKTLSLPLPVYYLKSQMRLKEGAKEWNTFLSNLFLEI